MTHRLGLKSWATALVLVAASACGSHSGDATPPSPPSSSVPPPTPASATTAPSPTSPSDAIAATVRHYFAVEDAVRQDSTKQLSAVSSVTTSIQRSALTRTIKNERAQHQHQTGATKVLRVVVQSVDLAHADPDGSNVPTASVDVCWDVTAVDLVDQTGTSVISPSRPDVGWIRFTVVNNHWPADPEGGWRISDGQTLKKAPCASS